ncbi:MULTISPECIES: LysE family translocator [unclassified Streptomyces]|uniref:LysE family translocator n=1 Tax=unclassified Streptomyces TaxID=2593676 RepID=UPI00380E8BDE
MPVDLAGFLGVVLLAYVIPGPDFLVIVRAAARRPALGRAAALGAQTGLCVHMSASAFGLSVIAAGSAVAFTVVKLAGACYLTYLGVRVLLDVRRGTGDRQTQTTETDPRTPRGDAGHPIPAAAGTSRRDSFVQGFLTNVLNPKAALFFLSVLPQFTHHGGSSTGQIFFLGALDIAIGVVYWSILVGFAAQLRSLLGRPGYRRRWERTTGWLFIGIGVGVAAAE